MGNIVVTIVMFGWIPAVLAMFSGLPPRRAVIAAFLLAWLFLPTAGFKLAEGIPVYDKMSATCAGVFLGAILFDTGTLLAFRPSWIDLPMLIWCLCPIASSVSNDLGLYNGLSTAFRQSVEWGLPYLIGRLYFRKLDDLRELAIGIFIGGLLYAPLCVWEMRMSPQLSSTVYGIAAKMTNSVRFGGWRPVVFMRDGLMVGMWMCMSALVGWWLWMSRAVPQVWRSMPPLWLMGGLFATALLCRSIGAVVLMTLGMAMLLAVARLGWRWVVWVLLLSAPAYIAIRCRGFGMARLWSLWRTKSRVSERPPWVIG